MNNIVLYKYLVVYEHESVYLWNGKMHKKPIVFFPFNLVGVFSNSFLTILFEA